MMSADEHAALSDSQGRVLVVDDDDDSRRLLRHLLERKGFEVVLADGGREALDRLRSESVDVILLDVMMPIMDGFAVCRELKKSAATASLPVILLTARDDMETRATGMNLGVSDFLAKPVTKEELYLRLRNQVDARRRAQVLEQVHKRAEAIGG